MPRQSSRPAADTRPMLKVRQVADQTGYCERQVRRFIAAEELPVHRFGRSIRISQADLDGFIARHRCKTK